MKPPLFTYEEIQRIYDVFRSESLLDYEHYKLDNSISAKCEKTLSANPKFREPMK